mmetsp:Transcript_26900/g.45356  ORF Transcript_26900/g.45356 Transcript_26900/m.45356 type:complete len:306 (+) Transcript_26900:50-967(+)
MARVLPLSPAYGADDGDALSVASSSIHSKDEEIDKEEEEEKAEALKNKSAFVKNRNRLRDTVLKQVLEDVMPDIGSYDIDGMAARASGEKSRIRRFLKFLGLMDLDLHEAVLSGSPRHLRRSIDNIKKKEEEDMGALINRYDEGGRTALSYAVKIKNDEMVEMLLDNDALPDVVDEDTGRTPLMYAVLLRATEVVKLLVKYSASINMGDYKCVTPLMLAVSNDDRKTTVFLCSKLAEVDAQDENGWTPLHYAVMSNSPKCVTHLLKEGADRTIRDTHKRRPLDLARYKDYGDIIAILSSSKTMYL